MRKPPLYDDRCINDWQSVITVAIGVAFTKALFYPWTDVRDETWLKEMILYWDEIQTIVPRALDHPYKTPTGLELEARGLLNPYYVDSDLDILYDLSPVIMEYLQSPSGLRLLETQRSFGYEIYPGKLPQDVEHELRHRQTDNGRIDVDKRFFEYYFSLLASRISERNGLGLLTDSPLSNQISNKGRTMSRLKFFELRSPKRTRRELTTSEAQNLAQGMLCEISIQRISIDPQTPLKRILSLKDKYRSDLRRFRQHIDLLTKDFPETKSIEALKQRLTDVYENSISDDLKCLKDDLRDCGIRSVFSDTPLILSVFGLVGSEIASLLYSGLRTPLISIPATSGILYSVVSKAVMYDRDRAKVLRDNPLTYLLRLEVLERTESH